MRPRSSRRPLRSSRWRTPFAGALRAPRPRISITGLRYFPPRKRNALSAVYAFMRRCDDIADDNTLSLADRHNKLADWLDKVHRALAGQPTDDPVLLALTDAQRTYQIPVGLLDQLAFGTAADLEYGQSEHAAGAPLVARYQTFEELRQYCYGVASVVGLVCIKIFGYRDPAAEPLAERCGLAFQLTNIIRDVKEDAAMGRVYFPEEDLLQFGLPAADLASPELCPHSSAAGAGGRPGPRMLSRMAKNLIPAGE